METVSNEVIERAIEILGEAGIPVEETEARLAKLVSDPMTVRRLADFIPEAFGLILIAHLGDGKMNIAMPSGFQAADTKRKWHSFPFSSEPIFIHATRVATTMYHNGLRDVFKTVSLKSSTVSSVNNALNQGAKLENATLSGPALIGIPAEIYPKPQGRCLRSFLIGD